jgi:hypothetical protein
MTALKVDRADLAAIRHRCVDAVDAACKHLDGRQLDEGEMVRITLTTTVLKNDQGHLYFGPMDGIANHV